MFILLPPLTLFDFFSLSRDSPALYPVWKLFFDPYLCAHLTYVRYTHTHAFAEFIPFSSGVLDFRANSHIKMVELLGATPPMLLNALGEGKIISVAFRRDVRYCLHFCTGSVVFSNSSLLIVVADLNR